MAAKLDLSAAPQRFLATLQQRERVWSRRAAGQAPTVRKRVTRVLRRKWLAAYKEANGLTELPDVPAPAPPVATRPDPASVKIVFFPEPETEPHDDPAARRQARRKIARRALHALRAVPQPRRVELKISSSGEAPLHLGTRSTDGPGLRRDDRAIFLEALGAAVLPGLEGREVETLEALGATVLDNEQVTLVAPVEGPPAESQRAGLAAGGPPWHLSHINIAAARAKGLYGKAVVIGILDTGIDAAHPEFTGKRVFFRAFDLLGEARTKQDPKDFQFHGTHVSGICAGATIGVAPAAMLAVAAVLTEPRVDGKMYGSTAQILTGLNWLARGGDGLPGPVDIVNASLGLPGTRPDYYERISALRTDGGRLVIAAIGNDGRQGIGHHTSPGNYDCVIGVGAVDAKDAPAAFSDWGQAGNPLDPTKPAVNKPDVSAPGVNILSAFPGRRFESLDGTSMAAPIISGVAALLIGQKSELRDDPDGLSQRLFQLVRSLNNQRCGRGCIDLTSV